MLVVNSIYDLKSMDGARIRGQNALIDLRIEHFFALYFDLGSWHIYSTLQVIKKFPNLVEQEENDECFWPIENEEIFVTLNLFQTDKIPRIYGWPA